MTEILQNPEELLPLTPAVFNILLALADGEKHGYSLRQDLFRKISERDPVVPREARQGGPDFKRTDVFRRQQGPGGNGLGRRYYRVA